MQQVELLVKLKIPDVTAFTAAGALRRRMGYAEVLKGLQRSDYYRLDLEAADQDGAFDVARELAEKTNVFVNPNKHVYEVRPATREAQNGTDGTHLVQVLITDPMDGSAEGSLAALQGRLGYEGKISGLLKGVLWTLELACESHERACELAEEIAVTRNMKQGVLMNPHFQECEIW